MFYPLNIFGIAYSSSINKYFAYICLIKSILSIILLPFSWAYTSIMFVRNKMFDWGILTSIIPNTYSVGVGNLHMGGTGKSPMVIWLANNIGNKSNLSVLSRGYGRKSKGYLELPLKIDSLMFGDEPSMIKLRMPEVGVFVCEKRVDALKNILISRPKDSLLILDDIMQHRHLKPHHLIMLSPYASPYYNEKVAPRGKLRESKCGYKRANSIVFTKCPANLSVEESKNIIKKIKPYSNQKVFFSTVKYGRFVPIFKNKKLFNKIVLVTGIANSLPLKNYIKQSHTLIKHFNYSDHYSFKIKDVNDWIYAQNGDDVSIVCTEKDAVKIRGFNALKNISFFYIPIALEFLFDKQVELINHIKNIQIKNK